MSSPKMLFIINSLLPGGAERSLVELLPRVRERGAETVLCCLARTEIGLEQEVADAGLEVRWLRSSHLMGRVRELRSIIREESPDLVHTTLFEADIAGRLATIGNDVPVMTTLANTTYEPARIAHDSNLTSWRVNAVRIVDGLTARRLTNHFHAVSRAVKDSAVAALGIDPNRITVVYRGRDPERLGRRTDHRRATVRETLGIEPDQELVLTVGRQEYQKGQLILLEAFKELASKRPNAVLLIAGRPGNASEALQDAAGRDERIRILGHRGDVPDLLAAADLFVFPSLWEGLGGVLIEALALEVPIVASDIPAIREVVVDGENALLTPPGESVPLRDAMSRVLEDRVLARRLVSGNRTRFNERFDLEVNSNRMVDLLMGQMLVDARG